MGHPAWPLFGLEVRTPRLTLRYLDDELAEDLLRVAVAGIHDPAFMPFAIPWTDHASPQLEQEALRFYWSTRAGTSSEHFRLMFAVIVEGIVVGASDVAADDFPIVRQFETGSWLGREFQGIGLGKELRMASLTLGFDGLGGEFALTAAYHDNGPSLGVTRSLGYDEVGRRWARRRDVADEQISFRMHRSHWETLRRGDISIHGIEAAREFLEL